MPDDKIPISRLEAQTLLAAVHYDISELTPEARAAIRKLYNLDDSSTIAEALRRQVME